MNNSFLKIVADDLISKHQDELSDFVVVFPNNRAKLFFNNYLILKFSRSFKKKF